MKIFDEEFEKKQKEYEQKTSKYFRENGNPLLTTPKTAKKGIKIKTKGDK